MKINEHNYESYLLDYIDDELSEAEQKLLLQYIAAHPGVEEELQWLQKTRPEKPENIIFPKKELLYRSATDRKKAVIIPWKKVAVAVAAAACLFLVFRIYFSPEKELPTTDKITVATKDKPAFPSKTIKPEPKENPVDQTKEKREEKKEEQTNKKTLFATQTTKSTTPATEIKKQDAASGKAKSSTAPVHPPIPPAIAQIEVQPMQPAANQLTTIPTKQIVEPQPPEATNSPGQKTGPTAQQAIAAGNSDPATITNTLQQLRNHKKTLDSSFTDKLFALQNKVKHPIKLLHIKKIKIGNVSFVFN